MKIQDQCCTAAQGRKLFELGITPMLSAFRHFTACPCPTGESYFEGICYADAPEMDMPAEYTYDAFTVAELGVMIGATMIKVMDAEEGEQDSVICSYHVSERWSVLDVEESNRWVCDAINENRTPLKIHPTEAQARAAMLIHLLETGALTASEANDRLTA